MSQARVVRAPRGPERTAQTWGAEGALRMLHNNLDPEVAERPEDLVVYGGSGRAARDWRCFDAIVDYESFPGWQDAVDSVEVLSRTPEGLGQDVRLFVDAKVRKIDYTLRYSYTRPTEIRWDFVEGNGMRDVDGVYTGWGTAAQVRLGRVTPDELAGLDLPAGSMGPKVEAACGFARNTGREAVIGSLTDIADIVTGTAGTRVLAE